MVMDNATRTVIDYFEQINRIPRCSQQEQRISQWLQQWAQNRELRIKRDDAGNLVISVPATHGLEDAPIVVLQGHMDMVCEKHADSKHDFSKDPIRMVPDGPWLTAQGTTLGADNGIALAMSMALVDDPQGVHPPLEIFFTVEEETGLTGVLKMDPSLISGKILINLDSEDEGVFVVGCAGGRNTTIEKQLEKQAIGDDDRVVKVVASGMRGGHSGIDIGKHRANANKVMSALLSAGAAVTPLQLVAFNGGSGRNVIPRACDARVACHRDRVRDLTSAMSTIADTIKNDFDSADPDLNIQIQPDDSPHSGRTAVRVADTTTVLDLLTGLPNGPVEMNASLPHLVQTSVNLSMVAIDNDTLCVTTNQRSAMTSRLDAICRTVEAVGRLAGARAVTDTGYPPWPADQESMLLKRCTELYRKLFQSEPDVQIMHAGLECGVIGDRCPGMEMISLGPTIENPHSPSERLYLPSVERVWRLLVALMEALGS